MSAWTCVECQLPDPYNGDGDGVGSCMCPRCERCGECQYCADTFGLHTCDDEEYGGWDDEWDDDGDWPVVPPVRPTHDVQVRGDLL